MQAAAPWMMKKNLPVLRTCLAASASSFHSTPHSSEKRKHKWDCPKGEQGARKPSRSYERYIVRQNRAEQKKALKNYLLYGKSSPHLEDAYIGGFRKVHHSRWSSKAHQGVHNQRKKKKDEARFSNFFRDEYYVHPDDFEEVFGAPHGFTWSRASWETVFGGRHGFNGSHASWEGFRFEGKSREKQIPSDSENESEDDTREISSLGSHTHRRILGLPPRGPLTLDDVKAAFRASALRWHPDRHPASSQAVAEEKFKLCVNAYNSLCGVIKAAA